MKTLIAITVIALTGIASSSQPVAQAQACGCTQCTCDVCLDCPNCCEDCECK